MALSGLSPTQEMPGIRQHVRLAAAARRMFIMPSMFQVRPKATARPDLRDSLDLMVSVCVCFLNQVT